MKTITLFCSAGMSTSLLVNKMKEAAAAGGKDYQIAAYSLGEAPNEAPKADVILIGPQVRFALEKLKASGLDGVLVSEAEKGKPVMGICLGMQLLFDKSLEYGEHEGLGLIRGEVVPFEGRINKELKIPHIGWNALEITQPDCPLFKYIKNADFVYFVHSYFADGCDESVTAYSEYDIPVTASVQSGNVFGCQFHPEKSGEVGLKILKAFCEI